MINPVYNVYIKKKVLKTKLTEYFKFFNVVGLKHFSHFDGSFKSHQNVNLHRFYEPSKSNKKVS